MTTEFAHDPDRESAREPDREFAHESDPPAGPRLGLIVLSADETIERDFRRLIPPETTLHVARLASAPTVTRETLGAMEEGIAAAAALLPPARFDAIGYACTSGAAVIGPDRVAERIGRAAPGTPTTDPLSALADACGRLGLRRLAILSPYIAEVSAALRAALAARGVSSPVFGTFNEAEESAVARIAPRSVRDAAVALARGADVDGVFLSCTNLRTLETLEEIEALTGKPALSSNQVLAWRLRDLAGDGAASCRIGRLMRL